MSEEDATPSKRSKRSSSMGLSSPASSGGPSSPSSGGLVTTDPPCAACKSLRRKCTRECIFLPYFPRDDPEKFGRVHKVFGASNVSKMLQELPVNQREDAVASLEFEAQARVQDPVYGCVGILCLLQKQVASLKDQLAQAQTPNQVQAQAQLVQPSDPNQVPSQVHAQIQPQLQTPGKGNSLNSTTGFSLLQTNEFNPKSQLPLVFEKNALENQQLVSHPNGLRVTIPKNPTVDDGSLSASFFPSHPPMGSSHTKPNPDVDSDLLDKFANMDGNLQPSNFVCFSPEPTLQGGLVVSPYAQSTFERNQNSRNSYQTIENS